MWDKDYCPICKAKLIFIHFAEESIYESYWYCQQEPVLDIRSTKTPVYHFKAIRREDEPYYESFLFYPFYIDSYEDYSNIYKYDSKNDIHFIMELPYLDLHWDQLDKVVQKLKTYVIMS